MCNCYCDEVPEQAYPKDWDFEVQLRKDARCLVMFFEFAQTYRDLNEAEKSALINAYRTLEN